MFIRGHHRSPLFRLLLALALLALVGSALAVPMPPLPVPAAATGEDIAHEGHCASLPAAVDDTEHGGMPQAPGNCCSVACHCVLLGHAVPVLAMVQVSLAHATTSLPPALTRPRPSPPPGPLLRPPIV